MYTFLLDVLQSLRGAGPSAFMGLFVYVWTVWTTKALAGRRYRPFRAGVTTSLSTTVIVPVYNEPPAIFRRALASVRVNAPTEFIAVVDGGDADLAAVAEEFCDRVLRIPKSGKRPAIAAGLAASDPRTEVVVVLDSDT